MIAFYHSDFRCSESHNDIEGSQFDETYLYIERDFLHHVHPLGKRLGHLLHTVEVLHWFLNVSVLIQ